MSSATNASQTTRLKSPLAIRTNAPEKGVVPNCTVPRPVFGTTGPPMATVSASPKCETARISGKKIRGALHKISEHVCDAEERAATAHSSPGPGSLRGEGSNRAACLHLR